MTDTTLTAPLRRDSNHQESISHSIRRVCVRFLAAAIALPAALPAGGLGVAALASLAALQAADARAGVTVTTFAGGGRPGGTASGNADGTGTAATFVEPYGITADSSGNLYVAEYSGNVIRKITPAGVVTKLAGGGTTGSEMGYGEGTGTAAKFQLPRGIAVNSSTGVVYVADTGNYRIRKIDNTGTVSTLAGSGAYGSADGAGTAASFKAPSGIAVDSAGTLYVADRMNHRIRRIDAAGVVSTLAGSSSGYADGTGTAAQFNEPTGIAVDSSGNVYVSDSVNQRIRKITPAGVVTTLAGSGNNGCTNGTGAAASFSYPDGLAVDGSGNLYVAGNNCNNIFKITPAGVVTTLAGGTYGYTDGTGTTASFRTPTGIALAGGNFYMADTMNNLIRKIIQAPGLSSSVPADNAANVAAGATIALTFDEAMSVGTGKLKIVNDTDSTTESIDVANPAGKFAWSADAKTLTVAPGTALAAGKNYHVEIDATAFKNASNAAYPGIADATTLNFSMAAPPANLPHREALKINGVDWPPGSPIPARPSQALFLDIAPASADLGKSSEIYVGADFGGKQTYFMDANKNWSLWDGVSPFPPYFSGPLPSIVTIDFGTLDLTSVAGAKLYVGYGLGAGAAANASTFANSTFSAWPIN